LDVRALPVKFGAGETVMVGRNQKSPIAVPVFKALRQYKTADELQSDLVPPERFKALLEMADDDMIKQYPAIPAIKIAPTLDDAYEALGAALKDEQQPKALPTAKSVKQIADEGDYF
jgi:hypothetical protein